MVQAKRNQRNGRSQAQFRSRSTRSSKSKLLSDPQQNTQLLTEQLRSMGLYAAPTVGDGNCLFRALSDQLYGSEVYHPKLRTDICDWIENNKVRYEPFVEDERGLQVHLRCMRENATYGGHLELSAFAHMAQRDVKVIQPGLVYVIEWNNASNEPQAESPDPDDPMLDEREKRRVRRDKKRAEKEKDILGEGSGSSVDSAGSQVGTIYVAYHDWEHFSSIRNLRGPHIGLPCVSELASPDTTIPERKKSLVIPKPKPVPSTRVRRPTSHLTAHDGDDRPSTPSQIPLPYSRSPSPQIVFPTFPSDSSAPPSTISSAPASTQPQRLTIRSHRSPKRSFDESSDASQSQSQPESQSTQSTATTLDVVAKRTRSSRRLVDLNSDATGDGLDPDVDFSTPELSATASTSPSSSSPSPPPPPIQPTLTRRQRKALGVPKQRSVLVSRGGRGAGKIIIPPGRYKRSAGAREGRQEDEHDEQEDASVDAEWTRNGNGRLDVRGFRELKI